MKHACKILVRFDTRCIYYDFLRENTEKQSPDMMQRAFILRFCGFLAWGPVGVTHTRLQKLSVVRPCAHVLAVQTRGIG